MAIKSFNIMPINIDFIMFFGKENGLNASKALDLIIDQARKEWADGEKSRDIQAKK